jgi:hypothetical protein
MKVKRPIIDYMKICKYCASKKSCSNCAYGEFGGCFLKRAPQIFTYPHTTQDDLYFRYGLMLEEMKKGHKKPKS